MIEFTEAVAPVVQSLAANALWHAGSLLFRSAKASDQETAEWHGLFAVQTLSVEDVIALTKDALDGTTLPTGLTTADVIEFLNYAETEVLIHELFIVRLLEQPENEAELVAKTFELLMRERLPACGESAAGDLAEVLFGALDGACKHLLRHIDSASETARSSIQQLAGLSSIVATIKSVDRHLKLLVDRQSVNHASWTRYEEEYLKFLQRRHGILILPDSDIERRVPVEDLYVEAQLTQSDGTTTSLPGGLERHRRVVVTGHPGGGKSTLAGVVAHRVAKDGKRIPFLVNLREYGPDYADGLLILDHLSKVLSLRTQAATPGLWIESILQGGRGVVIFDGLDELLDPRARRDIRDAVEEFSSQYPFAHILVTSRVVGYEQAPLSPSEFATLSLGEFTRQGVETYTRSWFKIAMQDLDPETRQRRFEAFMSESESVEEIRSNPLMLSLMCVLYRGDNYIPESRLALYEECAKLLFKKWDRSRGITVRLEIGPDIDAALMHLAYWMLTTDHGDEGVTEQKLIDSCVDYLVPRRFNERAEAYGVAEEFVHYCRGRAWVLADAGLSESGEALYKFTHRTFLEFYAASQLARVSGTPERMAETLAPHLAMEQLDVVAQLALQIANRGHDRGADRLVTALMDEISERDDNERGYVFEFIARSLRHHIAAPALLRDVTERTVELTLSMAEPDADTTTSIRHGLVDHPLPLSELLRAHRSNLNEISTSLRDVLEPFVREFPVPGSTRHDRAFIIAAMARVIIRTDETVLPREVYDLWGTWSISLVGEMFPEGLTLNYDDHTPLVLVAALEARLVDFQPFMDKAEFAVLWETPFNPVLGMTRVGTLALLIGWIVGDFWERVMQRQTVEQILRELTKTVEHATLPIVSRRRNDHVTGDSPSRYDLIPSELWPAIAVLFCMGYEACLPESEPLEIEDGIDTDAVETEGIGAETDDPSSIAQHLGRWNTLPAYLVGSSDDQHPVRVLTRNLCRARVGYSPTSIDDAFSALPTKERAIEELLRSWAAGEVDFFDFQPDPDEA